MSPWLSRGVATTSHTSRPVPRTAGRRPEAFYEMDHGVVIVAQTLLDVPLSKRPWRHALLVESADGGAHPVKQAGPVISRGSIRRSLRVPHAPVSDRPVAQ